MAFFDKLDSLKDKAVDLAQSGAAKSKELAEIGKLKLSSASEEDSIKKAYIEIGKLYYAERGMTPDAALKWVEEKMIPYYPLGVYKDRSAQEEAK